MEFREHVRVHAVTHQERADDTDLHSALADHIADLELTLVVRDGQLHAVSAAAGAVDQTIGTVALATLTLPDGTEFESLPLDPSTPERGDEFTGVLRFLGTLPNGSETLSLKMAGIDVEIPSAVTQPSSTAIEPPLADLPGLRDLLDQKLSTEPMPTSIITIGPEVDPED